MNLIIRQEQPEDYYAVEELTRDTFWPHSWGANCDEHLLVHKLRKSPAFVPELDLVAELDGKIVGHIIYSASKIVDTNDKSFETLTFGPLSVHPDYQSMGVGKALMHRSFEIARKMGHKAVIIFGFPDYYPRIGFERAGDYGITTSDGKTFDPFMVYLLYEGALDGIKGKYYTDPVYESLTQEELLEFDKKFPPKADNIPVLISVLLNRLEPEAKKAIEALGNSVLAGITHSSERDISKLEGIDAKALETIRTTMNEHGFKWGTASSSHTNRG